MAETGENLKMNTEEALDWAIIALIVALIGAGFVWGVHHVNEFHPDLG